MASFLFFDVGGTLLHFSPSHAAVVGAALVDLGVDVTPERAAEAVRSARKSHGGRPDPIDLEANRTWWLGLFGRMLVNLGLEADDARRDELYASHRSGDWLMPAPDTVSTLQRLSDRGHRMAVISNWDETLEFILRRRGLLGFFEFVVSSADLGAAKPDRRIFDAALELANVPPTEAVHVGDEYDADVRGARGVGIRPVLLATRGAVPSGDAADTIGRLGELLDLLSQ
jgi:putative hydrolase of the HAD superfamily